MDNDPIPLTAIIMAAGQGTRMKSSLPKVLHPLLDKPLLFHVIENTIAVTHAKPVVVIGNGADLVRQVVGDQADFVLQKSQLGTADAVKAARELLENFPGNILICNGDMPLLTPATLKNLVDAQQKNSGPLSMLSVIMPDPHGFGRVVRDADGNVKAVVEEAQADAETLKIKELNAGVYCVQSKWLWPALDRIQVSPKGEYYLTDLVEVAVKDGLVVHCIAMPDPQESIGINNRAHLAEAEAVLRQRINQKWMMAGVTMIDPAITYISADSVLEQDVTLYPNTHLYGACVVKKGSRLGPGAYLYDTVVGQDCQIGPEVVVKHASLPDGQKMMYMIVDES